MKMYILFLLFDDWYYFKYDKEQKLKINYIYCSRIDRGAREINNYCFLPYYQLIKILLKYYKIFHKYSVT